MCVTGWLLLGWVCEWVGECVCVGLDEFLCHNATNSLLIFLMLLGNKPSESKILQAPSTRVGTFPGKIGFKQRSGISHKPGISP